MSLEYQLIVKVQKIKEGFCDCGIKASWLYMPSYEGEQRNDYYCDTCVPRGCSCNQDLIDEDGDWDDVNNYYMPLDELGREYPCCEFWEVDEEELLECFQNL